MNFKHVGKIVFMPIKPEFADRILDGSKKYEFRKVAISAEVTHMVVYASSPIQRIIGIVEIGPVHQGSPTSTWEMTKSHAGISRNDFRRYFSGKSQAFAIEINRVFKLQRQLSPKLIEEGFRIPQSFSYVGEEFLEKILSEAA